jgi:hypothetical protein
MESFFSQTIYFDIGSLLDNRYLNIQHFYSNIRLKISNIVHKLCNMVKDISVNCCFFLFLRRRYCKDGDIPNTFTNHLSAPTLFRRTQKISLCVLYGGGGDVYLSLWPLTWISQIKSRDLHFILNVVGQQPSFLIFIRPTSDLHLHALKGHGNEADFLGFLQKLLPHRSYTLPFEPFRFWLRIRGDIRNRKTTPRLAELGSQRHSN